MKTYLITGGAGFIGSAFVRYIIKTHIDCRVINLDALTYAGNLSNLKTLKGEARHTFIKGDIQDGALLSDIFKTHDIDYVVNFAAESHVDRSILDPTIFVRTNVEGVVNLLQAAKEAWKTADGYKDGKKFLQVSTDEVYGALGEKGFFTEATPLSPHSPYSASKASADCFTKAFFDTYALPVNITRCSNNYGEYQFPEKLIPLMINNALEHKSLPVYGDGKQVRDWLYVKDHCRALDLVVQYAPAGEIYNIGGHNERANIDIVRLIIKYLSEKVQDGEINENLITHVKDRLGHDRRYGIDPTKIKEQLGWEPETFFDDGIKKTIDWYLDNKEWVKKITSGDYKDYYKTMYEGR